MSGLRERLAALADRWEEQYADHTKAGAVAESQMMAALQVASGSVRHLCAGEIRALLAEDETPVVTYECCGAPVGDVVRMDHRCAPVTPDDVETSQPTGLGDRKEEKDGKQGGVHPDRTWEVAEGPGGRGLHVGSGVLDRSGLDSQGRDADGAGRGVATDPAGVTRQPGTPNDVDLAEYLRDWRQEPCEHNTFLGPLCCAPCLRDRLLASDWLADRLAAARREALLEGRAQMWDETTEKVRALLKRMMARREKAVESSLKPVKALAEEWRCNCGGPSPEGRHRADCRSDYGDQLRAAIAQGRNAAKGGAS